MATSASTVSKDNAKEAGEEDASERRSVAFRVVSESAETTSNLLASTGTKLMSTISSSPEEEEPTLLEVAREWSAGASIDGVPYILQEGMSVCMRWTWAVILITCFGLMTYQLTVLVKDYLDYNTKTSQSTTVVEELEFPHVTVCNVNRYQKSLQEKYNITWPTNKQELDLLSQPFEDFVLATEFNGNLYYTSENPEAVRRMWFPQYTSFGRCWTFTTDDVVVSPGLAGGLFFMLNVQQEEYTTGSILAGVQLFILQKRVPVAVQMPFELIPVGVSHINFISEVQVFRETENPWSTCKSQAPVYSQLVCQSQCLTEATAKRCGCRHMDDLGVERFSDLDLCPREQFVCDKITSEDRAACGCKLAPCYEALYMAKSSNMGFSDVARDTLESLNISSDQVEKNFILIRVNFENMKRETIVESKSQSLAQLLGGIGGQMGLFMGISLISLFEVFGDLLGCRIIPRLWADRRVRLTRGRVD